MSYLDSGDPDLQDDRRFSLETAFESGRFPDSEQAKEIRRLLTEREYREAFDLIEVASELPPKDEMYFHALASVAALLGLDERAAYYKGRYEASDDYLAPFFERLEVAVRSICSVTEGMSPIIDVCFEAWPHEDWGALRALDFEADVAHLVDWLKALILRDPPPGAIDGLWFGLANPYHGDEPTSDMYVGGGEDAARDPGAWAENLTWAPDGDARSQALDRIYRIAYGKGADGLCNRAEYPLCLAYACLAVRRLATTLPPAVLLGEAQARVIQVGYPDGDFLRIGTLTSEGLTFPRDAMI
jgi:hypothetical protein